MDKKTGVFHSRTRDEVVVLWRGQEVASYPNMDAFINEHLKAVEALEQAQADLLEAEYRDPFK